ncbi:MAG: flagellar biosynthesis regulatory protein FlaF [Nitrospirae bacterium]|nr:MAG: flagellar biosynthesis regulatory protein FlaF [Nitrospirota bacterium]
MAANPLDAYKQVDKTTQTGRELEASVLVKAAMAMKECQDNWDAANRDEMLQLAIKYNQMIWSIFQTELVQGTNPLPQKLREDLLSLSSFIDKQSLKALAFPSPQVLTVLININMNIAAGLRLSGGEAPQNP